MAIRMDDGTEFVAGRRHHVAGRSGHDAWVVGDEPAIVVDWFGRATMQRTDQAAAGDGRRAAGFVPKIQREVG